MVGSKTTCHGRLWKSADLNLIPSYFCFQYQALREDNVEMSGLSSWGSPHTQYLGDRETTNEAGALYRWPCSMLRTSLLIIWKEKECVTRSIGRVWATQSRAHSHDISSARATWKAAMELLIIFLCYPVTAHGQMQLYVDAVIYIANTHRWTSSTCLIPGSILYIYTAQWYYTLCQAPIYQFTYPIYVELHFRLSHLPSN